MRHAILFALAAGIATAPMTARATTPEQLFRHILADPGFMFGHPHRAPRHAASLPADTPLIDVPMPHLRPAGGTHPLAYQTEAPRIVAAPLEPVPMPHVSPADGQTLAVAPSPESKTLPAAAVVSPPLPTPAPARPVEVASLAPTSAPSTEVAEGGAVCRVALAELGATAQPLPPISEGACGMPDPVRLTALDHGALKIDGNATVDCAVATKLAHFVDTTIEPKAQATLGGKVTALRILDSYSCRNRDGLASAKLSEHAHGNAIDIGAFQIDGKRWIAVGDSSNGIEENNFFVGVREAACGPFTTVLGPGSDSYHANHLHLDLIERRTAGPSHGLYCH
jgi:hypothetical protein